MTKTNRKVVIALALSLIVNGYLFIQYSRLQIEISLALGLIDVFDSQLNRSLNEPSQATEFTNYVEGYYVSGTVIRSGTPLDKIVERRRAQVVAELRQQASVADWKTPTPE